MLAIHRRCGQHLSVSVYTRDAKGAGERIAPLLGASQVNINDSLIPTAIPDTAIAGHGESGWGASRGRAGLLGLSRPVAVSRTSTRIRTPLEEPDAKFVKRFSGFVGWMFR
jgi:aldehyde dehydrogenase (NAD+)